MVVHVVEKRYMGEFVEVILIRMYGPDEFVLTMSKEEARHFDRGMNYEMTFKPAFWLVGGPSK